MSLRERVATIALAGLGLAGLPAAAADACSEPAKPMTNIGRVESRGQVLDRGLTPFNFNTGEAIRYFRALVEVRGAAQAKWHLTIRDQLQRVLETMSSTHVRDGTTKWTHRIEARNTVYFDLDTSSSQVQIEVKRVIVMPEAAERTYYSTQTKDVYRFDDIEAFPSNKRTLGDFVGFLMSSWDSRSWCCSGVAVGEDLFLTNWHCGGDEERMKPEGFWTKDVCANTIIDMSWDRDDADREFICEEVIAKDIPNDFALLRVKSLHGDDALRRPVIRASRIGKDEPITIVHHPACRRKQVSTACEVGNKDYDGWIPGFVKGDPAYANFKRIAKGDFTHPCDTEGGSSGSAVFDKDNRLVGLHHVGFEIVNNVCDKENKAVHIESVIGAMKPEVAERLKAR